MMELPELIKYDKTEFRYVYFFMYCSMYYITHLYDSIVLRMRCGII